MIEVEVSGSMVAGTLYISGTNQNFIFDKES
jgi:hypothetical protein